MRGFGRATKQLEDLAFYVYELLIAEEHKWRIDGELVIPTYEDVKLLLKRIIDQVRKSTTPISVETGGLLVKVSDGHIDVYINVGAVNE